MANRNSVLTDGKLKNETVEPLHYRIGFRDETAPGGVRFLQLSCHAILALEGMVDLYRVVNGRLMRSAAYGGVVSVEEL